MTEQLPDLQEWCILRAMADNPPMAWEETIEKARAVYGQVLAGSVQAPDYLAAPIAEARSV